MKRFDGLITGVLLLALALLPEGCSTQDLVEATFPQGIGLQEFPITFELPPQFTDTVAVYELTPPDCQRNRKTYGQVWYDSSAAENGQPPRRMITFLWELMSGAGGKSRIFSFKPPDSPVPPAFTFSEREGKFLDISDSGAPVLSYVFGMNLKEGVPEDRRRSSYIHPLYGLDGEVLTDDFPQDHFHHRGIFWTWPQVYIGADSVLSLWDIRGIYQRFEGWLARESGPVFAGLGVQNGWYAGERRVVDEKVIVKIYRAGELGRILDFELRWEALETPVTLLGAPEENKGYGGFGFRFAPFDNPVITTSEGVQNQDSNRVPFPWADFSANFTGAPGASGAAIFDHPGNIDYPNGWTLRHYGFVGIAWPGVEPFVLQPGNPVIARYRVLLHRGDAVEGDVASAYNAYREQPQARVLVK